MENSITSDDFSADPSVAADCVQSAPIRILLPDGRAVVLLSELTYELLTKGRVARRVEDLDPQIIEAIGKTTMDAQHDHLDRLLEP